MEKGFDKEKRTFASTASVCGSDDVIKKHSVYLPASTPTNSHRWTTIRERGANYDIWAYTSGVVVGATSHAQPFASSDAYADVNFESMI